MTKHKGATQMTDSVFIKIDGFPVPWARAGSVGARRFTPPKMADWKTLAGFRAKQAMQGNPLFNFPLRAIYTAVYEAPSSWPQWKKEAALAGKIGKTSPPDIDNLFKCVADAFNGVVYTDDALIVNSHIRKVYGKAPMVCVNVAREEGLLPPTCARKEMIAFDKALNNHVVELLRMENGK